MSSAYSRPRSIRLLSCVAVALSSALICAGHARAATFTVDTLVDEDDGVGTAGVSLRDAINAAEANGQDDTIVFSVTGTITLTVGNAFTRLPNITTNMVIQGPGAPQLTISGGSTRALFFIDGGTVAIRDLTLADGRATGGNGTSASGGAGGGGAAGMGGALFMNAGSVSCENLIFSDNQVVGANGGKGGDDTDSAGCGGGGVGGNCVASSGGSGGPLGGSGGVGGGAGGEGAGGGGLYQGTGGPGGFGGGGAGGGTRFDFGSPGGLGGFGGGGGGGGSCGMGSGGAGGDGGLHAGNGGDGIAGGSGDAYGGGGGGAGLGGAVFVRAGSASLSDCQFLANSAAGGAGGLHGDGGGQDGSPGQSRGGAIFVNTGAFLSYEGIRFSGNSAADAAGTFTDNQSVYGALIIPDSPSIYSISPVDSDPTGATEVEFIARFSENVKGVDAADFGLVCSGTATGSISTCVAVNGLTYVIAVTGVSGDGALRLDFVNDASVSTLLGELIGPMHFAGEELEIDTPPEVLSIAVASSTATTVDYTVTFDEDVTGVDVGDFVVTTTHGAAAAVTDVAQVSGSVYTVTVDGFPDACTVRLDLADNDSIRDVYNSALVGTGTENGDFEGDVHIVGAPPPYVESIIRSNLIDSIVNSTSVSFKVQFSQVVSNVSVPANFRMTSTGTVVGTLGTIIDLGGGLWEITVDGIAGDGTLGLDLIDADIIVNGSTVELGGPGLGNGDFTSGEVYTIDQTPPSVASVRCEGADPEAARSVLFTVTFSEDVENVDLADFAVDAAFTGTGAVTAATPNTRTDVFTVTVSNVAGEGELYLEVLDDGTITDQAGNALTGPYTSSENFDPPPYVDQVTEGTGSGETSVTFIVTFTEDVMGVEDQANFAIVKTHTAECDDIFAMVPTSASEYNVIVSAIDGAGTLRLDVIDGDLIRDLSGNPLGGVGSGNGDYTEGAPHIVEVAGAMPPHVMSVVRVNANPTNRAVVYFTVTFSGAIGGVDVADFALSGTATGRVADVTPAGPTDTYTVTVDRVLSDGTLGLDVLAAGTTPALGGDFTAGEVYDVDMTPPEVVSVAVAGAPESDAGAVSFDVTFSEDVTGVDTSDCILTKAAGVTGYVAGVSALSGDVYRVTVAGVGGEGTIRLDVVDDDSIADLATNPLAGPGLGTGDTIGGSHSVAPAPLGDDWFGSCAAGAPSSAGTPMAVAFLVLLGWFCLRLRRRRAGVR